MNDSREGYRLSSVADPRLRAPVYVAGAQRLSIFDLLARFADPSSHLDGIWRRSDLHIKVGQPVCYRFDNELQPLPAGVPVSAQVAEELVLPLLTDAQARRLLSDAPADVDASFELDGEGLSFRLNAFHDRDGLACAIRVLPRQVPDVSAIGIPTDQTWRDISALTQGLVLVAGISGSGKSTTVASLLHRINRERAVRIITLEDPIEYVLEGERSVISQRELGRHIPSFHKGLRSALREDPDLIFVGEMRDRDTAALALSAAETGHLVFSTLHTRDTVGSISRIVDMFPPERVREISTRLSFSLSYVLAQKLVVRRDARGRRLVMEVLRNVSAIANLIRTGQWHQIYSTIESHGRQGLITLERHLLQLVRAGEISRESARRAANHPAMLG
ncbi:MAG: PilT/PilU family type 4a pilus ATPase [Acidobacteriota bacterium]|nr:MAG: PilT/PilU family type 4a pilus ATPase [Acidobacteriota bacterium]